MYINSSTKLPSSHLVKNGVRNASFQPKAALSVSSRTAAPTEPTVRNEFNQSVWLHTSERENCGMESMGHRKACPDGNNTNTRSARVFNFKSQISLQRCKHVPWHEPPKHDRRRSFRAPVYSSLMLAQAQQSSSKVSEAKIPDPFQQLWCAKESESLGRGQPWVDVLRLHVTAMWHHHRSPG